MQQTWVASLGWEDPLEKEMVTHSSILTQKIPWMEEPVGYSSQGHKESDMTEQITLQPVPRVQQLCQNNGHYVLSQA